MAAVTMLDRLIEAGLKESYNLHEPCNCRFNVPHWAASSIQDLARPD